MAEWKEYTLGELLQYEQPTAYIVDTALRQAEALRQSILKKAFEGKLI